MKILKCFAVLAGMLAGSHAFAQQIDSRVVAGPKPYEVYCEVFCYSTDSFSSKMSVEVDLGQVERFLSKDRVLADEQGRPLVFNSMMDAANYMAERGWTFKQAYVTTSMSDGKMMNSYVHWIMGKVITDKSEITEGLRTATKAR